jgi:hypothetical protein
MSRRAELLLLYLRYLKKRQARETPTPCDPAQASLSSSSQSVRFT